MKALSALSLFLLVFTSHSAAAQTASSYIKQCGVPETYDLEIYGDFDICNYYMRQLNYKGEADKFKRQLKKRQALFAAPRNMLYNEYKRALDYMHYGEDDHMEVVGDAAQDYPRGVQ